MRGHILTSIWDNSSGQRVILGKIGSGYFSATGKYRRKKRKSRNKSGNKNPSEKLNPETKRRNIFRFTAIDKEMAAFELNVSSLVVLFSLVFVVLGLFLALTFFFKKDHAIDDEERLNIERTKILWIGASALALISLVAMKGERALGRHRHVVRT